MRRTEQRPHYTMVDEERGKEKEVCEQAMERRERRMGCEEVWSWGQNTE